MPVHYLEGVEKIHLALSENGNPLCPDCGANSILFAARANSGLSGCLCPPVDTRIAHLETLAEARERLTLALDLIESQGHSLTCRCGPCEASWLIRNGVA